LPRSPRADAAHDGSRNGGASDRHVAATPTQGAGGATLPQRRPDFGTVTLQAQGGPVVDKISPCLWFDGEAEEAARFYTSIFPNSNITSVDRTPGDTPSGPKNSVLTVNFTLDGQSFIGLNGGPEFKFNEAISLSIDCDDQAEVDRYWDALLADGGEPSVCGWLKDKFGVSWQVVPRQLPEMLNSSDREAAARALEAMLKMVKIDVAELERAYSGDAVPVG
jgi:predicted 3-demethylubiquinone-9 3-methyltransferase (glyoxalase superfamily)